MFPNLRLPQQVYVCCAPWLWSLGLGFLKVVLTSRLREEEGRECFGPFSLLSTRIPAPSSSRPSFSQAFFLLLMSLILQWVYRSRAAKRLWIPPVCSPGCVHSCTGTSEVNPAMLMSPLPLRAPCRMPTNNPDYVPCFTPKLVFPCFPPPRCFPLVVLKSSHTRSPPLFSLCPLARVLLTSCPLLVFLGLIHWEFLFWSAISLNYCLLLLSIMSCHSSHCCLFWRHHRTRWATYRHTLIDDTVKLQVMGTLRNSRIWPKETSLSFTGWSDQSCIRGRTPCIRANLVLTGWGVTLRRRPRLLQGMLKEPVEHADY